MNHTYLGCQPVSNSTVSFVVDSRHVGEPILSVVRHTFSRMQGGRKAMFQGPKHLRRYLIAAAIQKHKENRIEYRQVMHCSSVEFVPRYFWDADKKKVLIAPEVIPADMAAMMPQSV